MAIVGDSGVTGAASSARIEATVSNLGSLFMSFLREDRGYSQSKEPLTRVMFSGEEYKIAGNRFKVLLMNLGAKLALRLDVPENSFGYIVGRKLGIPARDIVLVGQDGVMVETIPHQFARIFEMRTSTLPPNVLLSYTANDLCDVRIFEQPLEVTADKFKDSLKMAWERAAPYMKAHRKGTRIFVLAPFDIVNLITNPDVLAQKVNVEGQGEITCGQLRHGEHTLTFGAWFMLRTLNLMCPSVTQTHLEDSENLARLRDVQNAFSEAWRAQIDQLNLEYNSKEIKFQYVEATRTLPFATGDLGNDCFHPSAQGHKKIAESVLAEVVQ